MACDKRVSYDEDGVTLRTRVICRSLRGKYGDKRAADMLWGLLLVHNTAVNGLTSEEGEQVYCEMRKIIDPVEIAGHLDDINRSILAGKMVEEVEGKDEPEDFCADCGQKFMTAELGQDGLCPMCGEEVFTCAACGEPARAGVALEGICEFCLDSGVQP